MSFEPDWSLYRTFLAAVEEHSLSGAARRLGLTQPTVACHIDALEEAVGANLFLRSQRGLIPTEMALDFKPYAETLASTAAALLRTASGRAGEVCGTVRVSASEGVGVEHLAPILARLRRRHPSLVMELVLSNAVDDLLQREADIALRIVEPTQEALIVQRLPPIALGLHAHRSYLERRGTPTSVQDLAGHDLIGFDRETPAIRAGFGTGICQMSVARRDSDLVHVLADGVSINLGLWVVTHENQSVHPRTC